MISRWSTTPGTPRTDEDFHGTYSLYYFGFTWCPDVCPSAMLVMAQVVEDLAAQNMTVQPIFVTVDPQRDTVEKLAAYVAQLPGLIGLTGSDVQVAQALQSFGITRRSQADGPDDTSYQVDHTSLFYLMGPDGTFIQHYLPTRGPRRSLSKSSANSRAERPWPRASSSPRRRRAAARPCCARASWRIFAKAAVPSAPSRQALTTSTPAITGSPLATTALISTPGGCGPRPWRAVSRRSAQAPTS